MTESDAQLAAAIAHEAGQLLLQVRATASGDVGREGDLRANELILRRLADQRPDDAVLSEESADSPARLRAERVWIVDPLDGTREFAMPGRDDWAVHVALWEADKGLTAAAVAQPALDAVFSSDRPEPPRGVPGKPPVVVVSDSRPPGFAGAVADAVGGRVEPMGSAGAKAMAVLRGRADAYLHAGGQWEWDSAAPVGVLQASGFHATRIDGAPLLYNQPRPYLPDLLICRPELAEPLLDALSRLATS